jgi:hypothetical protein
MYKFRHNDYVQIINHSEERCNGRYGYVRDVTHAYSGQVFYNVEVDDRPDMYCVCTDDELMEG